MNTETKGSGQFLRRTYALVALVYAIIATVLISCGQQSTAPKEDRELTNSPLSTAPEEDLGLVNSPLSVVIDGLLNPAGVELHNGHILIAEQGTGEPDFSAGITLITATGESGRLVTGLPSGRDSGDLSGVPFVRVSPDGHTLYTSHFNLGALYTLDITDGLSVPESPLHADAFAEHMMPLNAVQLINPFDLTFDLRDEPIVSDASNNGLAKATDNDLTRFFHRFAEIENDNGGKRLIDAVPTGITRVGAEYFVTLTGGCPYPPASGLLVAVDEARNQRTIAAGLNMPIDVFRDSNDTIWVLEFAQFDPDGSCFSGSGYLPQTGRLSRQRDDGALIPVLVDLDFPVSVAISEAGTAYISEIFAGRVISIADIDGIDQPFSVANRLTKLDPQYEAATIPPQFLQERNAVEPESMPAPEAESLTFRDVAAERGLNFQHGAFREALSEDPIAMMGGGLCWIDYDKDGQLDLYLVNSHATAESDFWNANVGLPTNALYHNDNGAFADVSHQTGTDLALRGNGCVAADLNQDGWSDIYITADGPNALLWNNGDGTFTEGASAAGVATTEWNTAASIGDLNGDQLPDLFVAAYIDLNNKIPNPSGAFPQDFYGLPDRLYLNQGDGTFREVTEAAGLTLEERGLGSVMSDLDNDGDLDLYIANDGHRNRLYINEPADNELGFTMIEVTLAADVGDSGSGMGVTSADYDGDGQLDLFVTNWEAEINALYRNEIAEKDELVFRYSTYRLGLGGVGDGLTGWGTAWADFDHDRDSDLIVVNGRVPITDFSTDPELVKFYANRLAQGSPNSFRDFTNQVGLGIDGVGPRLARGSATADFDNDGDLDIAINQIGGTVTLLLNEGKKGNWLIVAPDKPTPGLRVTATLPNGETIVREQLSGSSYLASEDPRLHFGLGEFEEVAELLVQWPDSDPIVMEAQPANHIITLNSTSP